MQSESSKIRVLKRELNKRGRIISSMYRISQLLKAPSNRDKILMAILKESQKIFGFTRGLILLINKKNESLESIYGIGFSPEEQNHAFTHPIYMKTQIGRETIAAVTGKVVYVRNVREALDLTDFDQKMEKIWKRISALVVPLKINNKVIGVIAGDSTDKEIILSEGDIKLFMTFANQASLIFENARLYDQVMLARNIAENVLEGAPDGILGIDRHKRIRSINRKAEEILNLKKRKVIGKPISDIMRKDIIDLMASAMEENRPMPYREIINSKRIGEEEIYGVNTSVVRSQSDKVKGAIITIRDLTQIKQTEAMLRRVEKLSSLGQMSAGIAHEIRNPLASINFNVQLLRKRMGEDDPSQQTIRNTLEGVERIKTVIQRTLDFTKDINPAMQYGDIESVLTEAIMLTTQQFKFRKIKINKDFCHNLPKILFDPHQIRNVFVNLLLNAAEAMPRGGTVTIRRLIEEPSNLNGTEKLLIIIKDNGIGISHDNLKRIFDPFFTTRQEGTGLGLSIVHKILEQHNFSIDVRSRENRGTSFFLRFPFKHEVKLL
jgi:PAS domain S-box-containing protein